jgi:replicative DNA helicase
VGLAESRTDDVSNAVSVQNDAERRSWDKLAASQREAALARGGLDFSAAPTWPWPSLQKLVGPLLPDELIDVGARTGCGKTTFLLNQLGHLTTCGVPVLYIGQEMAPEQLRRKWAALRLGYDAPAVLRNEWGALPAGAREAVDSDIVKQTTPPLVELAHFADARRVDTEQVRRWTKFAVSRGCRVIILDHIHRMTFSASAADLTRDMGEAVRTAKELAVAHHITFVIAAQLNRPERDAALLGDYMPPPLSALKQTGALEEEADVVLLLHKALKRTTSVGDLKAVRQGVRPMSDVVEPNIMAVRVGKHRLDGGAVDHTEWLVVDSVGRLTEKAPVWRTPDVEERYGV